MAQPSIHGRDHKPSWAAGGPGADPLDWLESAVGTPYFRAYQFAQSNVITNNSDAFIRFDRWQTSDAAIMNSNGWIAGTPDYIDTVDCKVRGLYAVTLQVNFTPWGTAGGEIAFSIEDAGATYTEPPTVSMVASAKAGDGSTGFYSWTHIQSFPPIWSEQTTDTLAPDLPSMKFKMFNRESRTITTGLAMVEIHLLYAFDYEPLAIQSQA